MKQFIRDTWPLFGISALAFLIMWVILDINEWHAEYRYRVKYTLGRYSVTDYTDTLYQSPGKLEFRNTTGEMVQINGEFVIINQHD